MSRYTRLHARTQGGHDIRINGKLVNIHLARIVYKCEICLGDLEKWNSGLRCKENHDHRGFVHRDEAKAMIEQQQKLFNQMNEVYEIVDGQIVVKER